MSFVFELDPAKEASAEFIAYVGRLLQTALMEKKLSDNLTQSELARLLDVDRSRINRCFSGHANITIGTFAELAWALGCTPELELCKSENANRSNHFLCEDNDLHIKEVMLTRPDRERKTTDVRVANNAIKELEYDY